jgi:hypothetical protein
MGASVRRWAFQVRSTCQPGSRCRMGVAVHGRAPRACRWALGVGRCAAPPAACLGLRVLGVIGAAGRSLPLPHLPGCAGACRGGTVCGCTARTNRARCPGAAGRWRPRMARAAACRAGLGWAGPGLAPPGPAQPSPQASGRGLLPGSFASGAMDWRWLVLVVALCAPHLHIDCHSANCLSAPALVLDPSVVTAAEHVCVCCFDEYASTMCSGRCACAQPACGFACGRLRPAMVCPALPIAGPVDHTFTWLRSVH